MTTAMTPNASATFDPSSPADMVDRVQCACCGADVPRGESKACASCHAPICAACTRWYGHFMLVCDDCRLEPW